MRVCLPLFFFYAGIFFCIFVQSLIPILKIKNNTVPDCSNIQLGALPIFFSFFFLPLQENYASK